MIRILKFTLACTIIFLASCGSSGSQGGSASADGLLNAQDFKAKMDALSNEQLIDLRTHGELHGAGPIAGAQNLDYNAGRLNGALGSLDKSAPVMVYCASGGRSAKAYKLLKEFGFKEVYDLDGGIGAWVSSGFKVERHTH